MKTSYGFYAPRDYKNPDWENARCVQEWKNYVGEEAIKRWDTFTDEQKAAIAAGADESASREEWD